MKIELVLKKEVPGKWRALSPAGNGMPLNEADFYDFASNAGFDHPEPFNLANFDGDLDAWYNDIYKKLFSKDVAEGANPVAAAAQPKQLGGGPSDSQAAPAKISGPAYPTSSKKGPKNWDSMELDVDEDNDDNVDDFFKRLYKDADPDTRRAMMKSYTESNGTSLSTSWSEASHMTYKTEAPEGAEAKEWTS